MLYFGTGGTDATLDTVQNQFFAVYADNGTIRDSYTPAVGVKFFGGVSLNNSGQLIFSQGSNLSGNGLCSSSSGKVVALDANSFTSQFTFDTSSRITAPVYAAAGMAYTVTLKGELKASSYVATGSSSGGSPPSGGGSPPPGSSTGSTSSNKSMLVTGWRQVDQ